jgi:hypothetical protein
MARRGRERASLGRDYVRGMLGIVIGLLTLAGSVYFGVPFVNQHWTVSWVTMAGVLLLAVGTGNLGEAERRQRTRLVRDAERRARGEGYAGAAPAEFDAQLEVQLREQEREAGQAADQQFGARLEELATQLSVIVAAIDGEPSPPGRRAAPPAPRSAARGGTGRPPRKGA